MCKLISAEALTSFPDAINIVDDVKAVIWYTMSFSKQYLWLGMCGYV